MGKTKGIIKRIQSFMDSPKGRTYTNYIYSWGAAIVILGTLFKLTHIAGANLMLFVGMGAEVIVFFFSAFERPYDVAEDEKREEAAEGAMAHYAGQPVIINGPIVTGTGSYGNEENVAPAVIGGGGGTIQSAPAQVANVGNINEMDKVTEEYVEQVRALNEAIQRISQQTEALGRNLEEMDTLSRNLTGVNAIYEIQLRNAGGQLNSIDQVNEQTKKMAQQVEELNNLYARMIEAMTTNTNRQ